jgi:glycosyltransferase involved in cell wall biosynthesis
MPRHAPRARGSAPASMRIAVISPFLDRSHGTERVIIEQLEKFPLDAATQLHIYAQRVQDLRGITTYKNDAGSQANLDGSETKAENQLYWHKLPSLPGPHLLQYIFWFFANKLCRLWDAKLRHLNYDLLYSPGINATDADAVAVHVVFHEFYRQVLPELALQKIAIVHWPRLIHRRLYYKLIMRLEKNIYTNPRVSLAAVSSMVAHQLENYFQRKDVRVIPNGVDVEALSLARRLVLRGSAREHFHLASEDFTLLVIGNDLKKKGLDALLSALAKLPELPWKLLVVGSDETDPYKKIVHNYALSNRVMFLPPSPDVLQFYAAADAYVGPSLEDAYGLPVLEAMACGLPVLASSRAGVSEIIDHEINGIILRDPRDTLELLSALRRLIADPVFCRRLGEHAASTAQDHTWDRNAQSTWDWLNEVARDKHRRRTE